MNIIKLKNRFIHFSSVCACILWHEHRELRTICGSWPFFQHLVPRGWAQVVSLGGKRLYPLGHLIPWSLDKYWWWMSFLIYSARGSSYPQSRPPTVRAYSASFPPTPPQTYLWSFPFSFKIKIIFLSTCVCVHAHTSEHICSYRHNLYACQRICVEVIEKKSGISPCLPPCSAWFLVLCCECQASWPSASPDPDASAFHPSLRMMWLQMCTNMPGFTWVSLELTLQPPTDILKHWDHTHKPLCLLIFEISI